jgi:hypothetical protein
MIAPAFLVGLHAYRRLVGLDVSASEQFTLHCRSDWYEQLAGIDHRIIECRQRQLDAGVAAHRGLLTIDRFRVTVFANDQIDDHVAGENRLGQNALRRRSCLNALHFALPAGPLLALDHAHGVFGRANVEHLRLFVADDAGLLAALAADALLGCIVLPVHWLIGLGGNRIRKYHKKSVAIRFVYPAEVASSGFRRTANATEHEHGSRIG